MYRIKLLNKISIFDVGTRACSVPELAGKEPQKMNLNCLNSLQELMKI